jgi:hypothetical protein
VNCSSGAGSTYENVLGSRTSRNTKVLYRYPAQIDWVAHVSSGRFDDMLSNDFGYSITAVTYLKRP